MKNLLACTILFFIVATLVQPLPSGAATLQDEVERDINVHGHGHHHHHHHHRHHHMCPEMRRLQRCMFDIIALIEDGHPLTSSCCQDVKDVEHACHPHYPWFSFAHAYCRAVSNPPLPPAPVYSPPSPPPSPSPHAPPPQASPPQPAPKPVPVPVISPQPAPQPVPVSPQPAPEAASDRVTCEDSIRRFDSCVDDIAGHHLFNDEIGAPCCAAIQDILDTCKPQDWPAASWFVTSTDHCINRGQH